MIALSVLLRRSTHTLSHLRRERPRNDVLRVEKTPPALNTAELLVLPGLVKELKVEVTCAVRVRRTHERVKERLQIRDGRC